MANHKSADKKARRDEEARLRNRAARSAMKTAVKKFLSAVTGNDKKEASSLLGTTLGVVDRAAKKGIIHKNAANRAKSRLTKKVNAMA